MVWETRITGVSENRIELRGYPVEELMEKMSFAGVVYLMWKGELPNESEERLLNAILVSSVDHGPTPPSIQVARLITSAGACLSSAVAGGILAISRYHGGAIADTMRMLREYLEWKKNGKGEDYVRTKVERKERLYGIGHRLHTRDPRTVKLFELARREGYEGEYVRALLEISETLSKLKGRSFPVNVDGAIGAVLLELGFSEDFANAFFILSRVVGLVAHHVEERTEFKPMRKIDPDFKYVGEEGKRVDK
jgi:citrate synthase